MRDILRTTAERGAHTQHPGAIWVLTSVGVGLVSFLYTQWSESQSKKSENHHQATKAFFEAQFRIRQMNDVLDQAQLRLADEDGTAADAILLLFAGIGLGGITSFPLGDEANVWVNGTGSGNRKLPAGKGFKTQTSKATP